MGPGNTKSILPQTGTRKSLDLTTLELKILKPGKKQPSGEQKIDASNIITKHSTQRLDAVIFPHLPTSSKFFLSTAC